MNNKTSTILEFDLIAQELATLTNTQRGHDLALSLVPQVDANKIETTLKRTKALVITDRFRGGLPIESIVDLTEIFKRLEIKAVLSGTELSLIKNVFSSAQKVLSFFADISDENWFEDVKILEDLISKIKDFSLLDEQIQKTVDDSGKILDGASAELSRLRRQYSATQDKIRQILNDLTRGNKSKYLSEPTITIRNETLVLPVKAEYRSQFGGVVHDQSQSGQTLYIEPAAVNPLNDDLHEISLQETREINRILLMISKTLASEIDGIKNNNEIISMLDLIQAKARLAIRMDAVRPRIASEKGIDLIDAYHPMLDQTVAIKNSIKIGKDGITSLIITGPNTGGKTVLMKTVGILQMMAQSGLFITAGEQSSIYPYENILVDIGDEQSLEQNLSTFSSHMYNIRDILKTAGENSLVLLDELGAGTDPQEGAALAIAIIERLNELKTVSLITTHYPELKLYADESSFTQNASMEFDGETFKPTYRLLIGIPGQSNALSISKKIGLDDGILQNAQSFIDPESQKLNNLILDVVDKQRQVQRKLDELEAQKQSVQQKEQDLEKQLSDLEKTKAKEILDAKNEANHLISKAKKESESLLAQIRKERLKAGSGTGKNEQELQALVKQFDESRQDSSLEKNKILSRAKKAKELHVGDDVLVGEYNQIGELTKKLDNHHWEVRLGILKMVIDEEGLIKQNPKTEKKNKSKSKPIVKTTRVIKTASNEISGTLDLRGVRYEEAMNKLDRYLDQSVLNNLGTVEIIHGKGTGALRSGVTQMLRSDSRVAHFEFANPNGAGDGATIVELK